MKISHHRSGARKVTFTDGHGNRCFLKEDHTKEEDFIYLGVAYTQQGSDNTMMYLDRELVRELIPKLQYFLRTGLILPIDHPQEPDAPEEN